MFSKGHQSIQIKVSKELPQFSVVNITITSHLFYVLVIGNRENEGNCDGVVGSAAATAPPIFVTDNWLCSLFRERERE